MEFIQMIDVVSGLDEETKTAWEAAAPVIEYGERCDNLFDFMATVATMIDVYVTAHNMSLEEDDDMMQTIFNMRKARCEEFKRTF